MMRAAAVVLCLFIPTLLMLAAVLALEVIK